MTTIAFPTTLAERVVPFSWGLQRRDATYSSMFSSQSVEISTPLWIVSLTFAPSQEADSGELQSLLLQLKGRVNPLALWNLGRAIPRGTMRGTMTLNGAHAQGATSLSIVASGETSKTLFAGDLLGLGNGTTSQQVVMVQSDATSNGSGVIAVTSLIPLRNAFSSGAAVEWDKPKALFRLAAPKQAWDYQGNLVEGLSLDLIEDWRP